MNTTDTGGNMTDDTTEPMTAGDWQTLNRLARRAANGCGSMDDTAWYLYLGAASAAHNRYMAIMYPDFVASRASA
jgi:uncharacterized protein HemY